MNSKSQTSSSLFQNIMENYIYHILINKSYKQLVKKSGNIETSNNFVDFYQA